MKIKKKIIFYIINILSFYVLPLLIKDTGSAMFVILIIMPVICFTNSVFYGLKNGFKFLYGLIVAFMFIPTIFIFYNSSACIYIVVFGVIALIGNLVGAIFCKSERKNNRVDK